MKPENNHFDQIVEEGNPLRSAIFYLVCAWIVATVLQASNIFIRFEDQNINRLFETRPWIRWSNKSLSKLSPISIWQWHENHEIPRQWWSWDYTLSWLIEDNHPSVRNNIVIFNHLIEDEPPAEAIASHHWLKPLLEFPLRRSLYADWIKFLARAGARAIILDYEFPQYTTDDAGLAQAIVETSSGALTGKPVPVLFARVIGSRINGNAVAQLESGENGIISQLNKLTKNSSDQYTGSVGILLDQDQVARRLVSRIDTQYGTIKSIPLKIEEMLESKNYEGVPDQFLIDFNGGPGSETYKVRPLTYLLDPKEKARLADPHPSDEDVTVKGAIVIIGDGITDLFSTSTTNLGVSQMSGPVLLANAIDTIERRSWLNELSLASKCVYFLFIFSIISLLIFIAKVMQSKTTIPQERTLIFWIADVWLLLASLVLIYAIPCFAFAYFNTVLPVFSPAVASIISLIIMTLRERDRIKEHAFHAQIQSERERALLEAQSHQKELEAQEAKARIVFMMADQSRREEFIRRLNHDIRGPAGSINWTLVNLEKQVESDKLKEKVQLLIRNSQRLMKLVDELVNTYKGDDSATDNVVPRAVDLNELVMQCCSMHEPLAEEKYGSIRYEVPPTPLLARVNALKLLRVIDNLVRNAFLHNISNTNVVLKLESRKPNFQISVTDDGQGIREEDLKRLFADGFSTGDQDRKHEGLGLGIVQTLVEQLGGKVCVESVIEKGTTFRVLIPTKMMEMNA